MKAVRFLHTADLHLGKVEEIFKDNTIERTRQVFQCFEDIIALAVEKNLDFVLIAGDLFNSNSVDTAIVENVLRVIENAKLPVVISFGNHDPYNQSNPFFNRELPKNMHIIGAEECCITLEEANCRIYGKSFVTTCDKGTGRLSFVPPMDKKLNILMLHADTHEQGLNYISYDYMRNSRMNYIALGHVHKPSGLVKLNTVSYSYAGCPISQGFDEAGYKTVNLVTLTQHDCNIKRYQIEKSMHVKKNINITGYTSDEEIIKYIFENIKGSFGDNYKDNIYKITLFGQKSSNINIENIKSALQNELNHLKFVDGIKVEKS